MNLCIDLLMHNMVYEMSNTPSKLSVWVTQANNPSDRSQPIWPTNQEAVRNPLRPDYTKRPDPFGSLAGLTNDVCSSLLNPPSSPPLLLLHV